jgi:hypothetical protein
VIPKENRLDILFKTCPKNHQSIHIWLDGKIGNVIGGASIYVRESHYTNVLVVLENPQDVKDAEDFFSDYPEIYVNAESEKFINEIAD